MNPESDNDNPAVVMCDQCKGPVHLCEQADSTCRLKQHAAMWLAAGGMGIPESFSTIQANARMLAPLLRVVEDGAWERLSVARTDHLRKAEARIVELEKADHEAGDLIARIHHEHVLLAARVSELERHVQDGLEIADAGGTTADVGRVLSRANVGPRTTSKAGDDVGGSRG